MLQLALAIEFRSPRDFSSNRGSRKPIECLGGRLGPVAATTKALGVGSAHAPAILENSLERGGAGLHGFAFVKGGTPVSEFGRFRGLTQFATQFEVYGSATRL